MELWILFGSFVGLLVLGTPIAFCLAISSLFTILYLGMPPIIVVQRLNSGISAFALARHSLLHLCRRRHGARRHRREAGQACRLDGRHMRGGLGQVNIVASTMFGGVSGSAVADASAVGGLMIPQMKKRGYDVDYAVNITSVGAIIALLIPAVAQHDHLFDLGRRHDLHRRPVHRRHHPGLLLAASLMVAAYWVARKRGYPLKPSPLAPDRPPSSSTPSRLSC